MTPSFINQIILQHHFQVVDTAAASVDLKNHTSYVPLTSSLIATVVSSPQNTTLEAMNTDASTITSQSSFITCFLFSFRFTYALLGVKTQQRN